jgi:arylsulfatase A-like enzyme
MSLDRRSFLRTLGLASASLAAWPWVPGCSGRRARPNFVFILVDDLGWTDLGSFGSSFYETPNIDRLASEGLRFTGAYAAAPVCSPTRASIMTGKYPARLGTTDYFGAPQPDDVDKHWTRDKPLCPAPYRDSLPLEEVTLAEALREAGYATFFAGKWHLGGEGFSPEDQGFDVNKGGWASGGPYGGNRYFSPYGNPKLEDGPEGEHLPARLAAETCRFIEGRKDGPFFAFLSFYSVHTPLLARQDLEEKYEAKARSTQGGEPEWGTEGERRVRLVQNHAVYAGMVEAMDQAVGAVLDKIEDLGLREKTVVVFMSDNGGLSTSEGHPTSNLPLRAGKGWLYEGGIREPMIIRAPGLTRPGTTSAETVVSTDFYPTILELAGLRSRPGQHLDGTSLVPLLEGRASLGRTAVFWHYPHYGNQGGSPSGAVRIGDEKLIEFFEDDRVELYDIREDIGETRNLAGERPGRARELREMLHRWRREVGARMPAPNPARRKE